LQESEFERVGDDVTRSVDTRVIAATNRNLEKLVLDGDFREDLFYRISVFPIEVPPLRKRPDDVVQLAQHFLEQTCTDFGRKSLHLTKAQANALEAYDWPGNVRELKNVIERAVILTKGETLRLDLSMPATLQSSTNAGVQAPSKHDDLMTEDQMRDLQKQNLRKALEQSNWRVSGKEGAAALLGIRPTTLSDRIKSFGLKKPRR
jgi:transcriptional regulator with GAF, ATPase, and Fis domain